MRPGRVLAGMERSSTTALKHRIRGGRRPSRAVRLALIGIAGGAAAGVAAAGDIQASFGKGRIAPAAVAAAPLDPASPAPRDGYERAAWLDLSNRDDCRTLEPRLRHGCLDYVRGRGSGAPGRLDLPL